MHDAPEVLIVRKRLIALCFKLPHALRKPMRRKCISHRAFAERVNRPPSTRERVTLRNLVKVLHDVIERHHVFSVGHGFTPFASARIISTTSNESSAGIGVFGSASVNAP